MIALVYLKKSKNNMKPIYINAVSQISNQKPLSDEFFYEPIFHNKKFVRSIEPDYSKYFSPLESRRMGLLLKRGLATTIEVINNSGIKNPNAIISGTGLGCVENTEKFLLAMINNDEEMLTPTHFMQSTHNTIGSQIAINLKCNGYNSTYSHCGNSFDMALYDAFIQFLLNDIHSALVTSHDELTSNYFMMLEKINYWKEGEINEDILKNSLTKGSYAAESSVAFMISDNVEAGCMAKISNMIMLNNPGEDKIYNEINTPKEEIDAIVVGINGDVDNDEVYKNFCHKYYQGVPVLWYKHIFGESYSSSALGLYLSSLILKNQDIPEHFYYSNNNRNNKIKKVLFYNHFENKIHTAILLEKP